MKVVQIDKYTNLELAFMCLLGYFGNGTDRLTALGDRYTSVQPLVNRIVHGSIPVPEYKEEILEEIKNALMKYKPTEQDYLEYVDDLLEIVEKEVNVDG